MPENPRKEAFKTLIMDALREANGRPVERSALIDGARAKRPDLFDDEEPCYAGCRSNHPRWKHEFDRSVYDLSARHPPKLRSTGRRGRGREAAYELVP